MKLLTLNCHAWQERKQIEKIKYLAQCIHKEQYDVIALQEVSQKMDSKIQYGMVREDNYALILLQELHKLGSDKYHFAWDFSHIGFDIYEEGLAILTRHKMNQFDSFYVSKNDSKHFYKSRKIVRAKIPIETVDYDFFSIHLGWWNDPEEPFSDQVDRLLEHVSVDRISFLMGDFNNDAFNSRAGYDYALSKGFFDTFQLAEKKDSGFTMQGAIAGWGDNRNGQRIDWILCNKPLKIQSSRVLFNQKENQISDHFAVEVIAHSNK